jgi:hypothetical protein
MGSMLRLGEGGGSPPGQAAAEAAGTGASAGGAGETHRYQADLEKMARVERVVTARHPWFRSYTEYPPRATEAAVPTPPAA